MERRSLEDYYEMILRCAKCEFCKNVFISNTEHWQFAKQCPPGERFGFAAYYATGRIEIARGLLEGELKWTDKLLHILYTCTTCGACEHWCSIFREVYPLKIIMEMRIKAVKEVGPLPAHKRLMENIVKYHNPYGESHEQRFEWLPSTVKTSGESSLVYFAGCSSSYRQQQIARSTVNILSKLGVKFNVLGGEEWCCGAPLFEVGLVDEAKKTLEHNIKTLNKMKVEKVVFTCPACMYTFKEASKYEIEEPKFELQHITDFLLPKLEKIKMKGLNEKLTYHDPCRLGRGLGIYEQPRKILKLIPGLELVEMPRHMEDSWCCGGGGGVLAQYPDFALWTASQRLEEMKFVGVKKLVTSCPACKTTLSLAIPPRLRRAREIQVVDVMELLSKVIP